MMSIRYLAPLVECARRKNYMAPADKRGMREALLQRQFWHHLQDFVEESARAEYEQMRREHYIRAAAVAAMDVDAQQQPHHRPISSSQVAARPSSTGSKHLSKDKARTNTLPSDSHQVVPKLSSASLGPKKKLVGKAAGKKTKPHVIEAPATPATAVVPSAVAAPVRIPAPLKKRAIPTKVLQHQQQHQLQLQQQMVSQQNPQQNPQRANVAVYQHPVLYTIVTYAPASPDCDSPSCSPASPTATKPTAMVEHHQAMGREALDAAAKEFMHYLAQRHQHQALLAQQQAV